MTESELMSQVFEMCALFGWRTAHFRPAKTNHGWRTPVSGDGAGWPDLVLVSPERQQVLFRELKSATGKLSDEQQAWAQWLITAGQDYGVWRPGDIDEIAHTLSGRRPAKAGARP